MPTVSFCSPPGQPDIAHGRRSVAHAQRSLQTTRKAVTLRKKEAPSRTPARARARVGGARGMRGIAEVWVEDCGARARREQRRSPTTRATPRLCQGRRRLRASPLPSGTKSGQFLAGTARARGRNPGLFAFWEASKTQRIVGRTHSPNSHTKFDAGSISVSWGAHTRRRSR